MESQLKQPNPARVSMDFGVPKKGLVVFPGALGDFICFLPTLKEIAAMDPDLPLEIAARSEYAELLCDRDPAMTARALDCHPIGRLFSGPQSVGPEIRGDLGSFVFIYSWLGAGQSDFVNNLKACFTGDLRILPFSPLDTQVHIIDGYRSSLIKKAVPGLLPEIALRRDAETWCNRYWHRNGLLGKRVLALAPGSGSRMKNWPLSFYAAVARWWRTRTGGETLLLWGPVEEENMAHEPGLEAAIRVRGVSLGQLAALLRRCDLYLGNDSGPTHLAAAVGVATVALFGPTDPARWSPRGRNVLVLSKGEPCAPCGLAAARSCLHHKCLTEFRPEVVRGFLEAVVSGREILDKE